MPRASRPGMHQPARPIRRSSTDGYLLSSRPSTATRHQKFSVDGHVAVPKTKFPVKEIYHDINCGLREERAEIFGAVIFYFSCCKNSWKFFVRYFKVRLESGTLFAEVFYGEVVFHEILHRRDAETPRKAK